MLQPQRGQGCATRCVQAKSGPGAEIAERKVQILKRLVLPPLVVSGLSHQQSLARAAVARGPIRVCAFGPAVLHTPALANS